LKKSARGRKTNTPVWKRIVSVLMYCVFLVLILGIGTLFGWAMKSRMMMALATQALKPKDPKEVFQNSEGLTMLLLGCDEDRKWAGVERYTEDGWIAKPGEVIKCSARADMILVARLDFKSKKITGVSIPRDVYTQVPGYRARKINAYYRVGKMEDGPKHMQKAVEHVLPGVKIDRTVVLNYSAFQEMVDLVGGVPVTVGKSMNYDDNAGNVHIHLEPGTHRLNGYDSLMYVRYRKDNEGGGDSDFARQERQKAFLISFKNSLMADPLRLPQVFEKAVQMLGKTMNEDEIATLAFFSRSIPPNTIQLKQVPVREGRGTNLLIQDWELRKLLAELNMAGRADVTQR
jgi:LCP family protein required for cell wall assembly